MAGEAPRRIPVVFYRTRSGAEVVRDWLRSLDARDRNAIGLDLMRVQFHWPVGMPLCRAMSDGLWEVRTNLPSNRIARMLFCVTEDPFFMASSRRPGRHPIRNFPWRANEDGNSKPERRLQ